jgi:hypothetical protein
MFQGNNGSGLENRVQGPWGSVALTIRHPLSAKGGINFADKWRSVGRYSSLVNYRPRSLFEVWLRRCFHTLFVTSWCCLLIYFSVFSIGRLPWGFLVSSFLVTFSPHFIVKYFSVLAVMSDLNTYRNPSWCGIQIVQFIRICPDVFLSTLLSFLPSKRPRFSAIKDRWRNWQCFSRLYFQHSRKEAGWQVA